MQSSPVLGFALEGAWMLLASALIGMVATWTRIPYATALVLGGLAIAQTHLVRVPQLQPDLLLFALLPPLLFDAAFRLDARELRRVLRPVLLLAIPVVILSVLGVAGALVALLGLSFGAALLFGSIVGATDPVAVTSVFTRLGAPTHVTTMMEGESLVNDGVAIIVYEAAVALTTRGTFGATELGALLGRDVVIGLAFGGACGWLVSRITSLVDEHRVEMTLSTALAYGSYLGATMLHSSGALACVAAGLVHGSYGRRIGLSENSRTRLDDLWEYFGFLANGIVFLLVGFSVDPASVVRHVGAVAVAIVAVVVSRGLAIGGIAALVPSRARKTTPPELVLLTWGGLRGGLTVALALAMPRSLPERELLLAMAYGVVLFSMIVQALTLPPLVRKLGLARR